MLSKFRSAALLAITIGTALAGVATAQPRAQPAASTSASAEPPGMSAAELDRVLAPLASPDAAARQRAMKAAGELGPDAVPAIAARAAELRRTNPPGLRALLHGTRAQAGGDLADVLLARGQGDADAASMRAALEYAAMIRALSHLATTPALRVLVSMAPDAGGELKPELARVLRGLGDRAVPALIEARRDPSVETQRFAGYVLDLLNKRLPSDCVQTTSNQVLADVLRAYGTVRDLDAVPVILSFVNSDRAPVRAAARDALLAYGQDAIWKLREAYSSLTNAPAPEGMSANELARRLFDAYDRLRLEEVYALLDDGLSKQRAGKLEEAVAEFDKVLARQPLLDRRAEMAPGYLEYARSIADADRPGALAALHKAERLDPAPDVAAKVESAILALQGEDLLARGVTDAELFRRALALDPDDERARADLQKIEAASDERQTRLERWVAIGAALVVAMAAAILFAGRRRRRVASEV